MEKRLVIVHYKDKTLALQLLINAMVIAREVIPAMKWPARRSEFGEICKDKTLSLQAGDSLVVLLETKQDDGYSNFEVFTIMR